MARDFSELGADVFDDTVPQEKKHKLSKKARNYIVGLSITAVALGALVATAVVLSSTTLWNYSYLEALEFYYDETDGKSEATISKLNREKNYPANFRIPSVINGHKVTQIADSAFSGCTNLKSITMTDNITYIGDNAFEGCENLSKIRFSRNLVHLGNYAFLGTAYEANLPEDSCTVINGSFLIHVGERAFPENTVLLESEASLESFRASSYYDPSYNIAYFSDLEGDGSDCKIVSFMNGLFEENEDIVYVQIPSSLTELPAECFKGASYLTAVDISKTEMTSLNNSVFQNCISLSNIIINSDIVLEEVGEYCFANTGVGNDDIPSLSDLKVLGAGAFQNCTNLTSISYPDNLTSIPDYVFDGCTNLSSFVFDDANGTGEAITSIGIAAFRGTAISSFRVPYLVSTIYDYTFANCPNLTKVTVFSNQDDTIIPGSDEKIQQTDDNGDPLYDDNGDPIYMYETDDDGEPIIVDGDYVYIYNTSSSVKDGEYNTEIRGKLAGLTAIRSYAFANSSSFATLDNYYEDGISNAHAEVHGAVGEVHLPRTITTLNGAMSSGEGSMFEGTSVEKITIPYYAKNVGPYSYRYAANLKSITFEKAEKKDIDGNPTGEFTSAMLNIGQNCFEESGLESIEIPDTVTTVGKEAFKNCASLTSVHLPVNTSYKTILNGLFEGCATLSDISIPSQVTIIYNNAFKGVKNVSYFVIPSGISRIYEGAFSDMLHEGGGKTVIYLENTEAEYQKNSGIKDGTWHDDSVEVVFRDAWEYVDGVPTRK